MSVSLVEYQKLKAAADKLRADADRAQGALDATLAKLKVEHGCDRLEEAEALLEKYERAEHKAEQEYERELAKFKEEWGNVLRV